MSRPKANSKLRLPWQSDPEAQVQELATELALAIQLGRPLILLVAGASPAVRQHAEKQLADSLRRTGQRIKLLDAGKVANADIPTAIREYRRHADTIFFIHGLNAGGEAALRALNIRREYFTELRIRAVFWLDPKDEAALAHRAPDFWAFRHRAVSL